MRSLGLLILGTSLLAGCSTGPDPGLEATKKLNSNVTELERQCLGLQEHVRRSDAENAQMREQLATLTEENASLKKRLAATTPAPSASPPVAAPPAAQPQANKVANGQDATITKTYMYLGQPRTRAWCEQMYMKFADKIVRVDGKYLDIGKLTGNADWHR
jgi:outer membrane murein-binding lipoprotein Lpp